MRTCNDYLVETRHVRKKMWAQENIKLVEEYFQKGGTVEETVEEWQENWAGDGNLGRRKIDEIFRKKQD